MVSAIQNILPRPFSEETKYIFKDLSAYLGEPQRALIDHLDSRISTLDQTLENLERETKNISKTDRLRHFLKGVGAVILVAAIVLGGIASVAVSGYLVSPLLATLVAIATITAAGTIMKAYFEAKLTKQIAQVDILTQSAQRQKMAFGECAIHLDRLLEERLQFTQRLLKMQQAFEIREKNGEQILADQINALTPALRELNAFVNAKQIMRAM